MEEETLTLLVAIYPENHITRNRRRKEYNLGSDQDFSAVESTVSRLKKPIAETDADAKRKQLQNPAPKNRKHQQVQRKREKRLK